LGPGAHLRRAIGPLSDGARRTGAMSCLLRATVISVVVILACITTAVAQTPPDDEARRLLSALCQTNAVEPVCLIQADLGEDEAWLILRTACRTDANEPCKTYQQSQGASLVLDARSRSWKAFWENERLTLKYDVAGVPTLRLRPHDAKPLKVFVTGLSPLVYTAKPGTPKEEDVAVIAGLKTLLTLAGTGVQALI